MAYGDMAIGVMRPVSGFNNNSSAVAEMGDRGHNQPHHHNRFTALFPG